MAMTGGTAKLLHTGYADGNTAHPIRLYAYYKIAQDTEANLSMVSCGLYVTTVAGWWIGPWRDSKGSYVGTQANTFDGSIGQVDGTYWLVQNVRCLVEHAGDGSASFTFHWKWGVNSPWGRVQYPSGSFQIPLPTIPRASRLECPETGTLLEPMTLAVRPAAAGRRHRIYYQIANSSGELLSPDSTELSAIWTPQAFLARQNTNGTSLECQVTLETFADAAATESLGAESRIILLTIPDTPVFRPTLEASFTPDGALVPEGFPNDLYIESKSRVRATFTSRGNYDAAIQNVTLQVDGEAVTGASPLLSGFLKPGTRRVTLTATDSRGYQTRVSREIGVLPYAPPRIVPAAGEGDILLLRANGEGTADDAGGYVWVRAGVKFSPLDGNNAVTLSLLVAGEDMEATYPLDLAGEECDTLAGEGTLSPRKSYVAILRATDRLGCVGESTAAIPTEKITLHLGPGGGVGVGKYAEDPEGFDVALPATFREGVTIGEHPLADFVTLRSQADGWVVKRWASGDLLLLGGVELSDQPTGVPITLPLPAPVEAGTALLSFTGTALALPVEVAEATLTLRLFPLGDQEMDSGRLGVMIWGR